MTLRTEARFPGRCAHCGGRITLGQPIARATTGDKWQHANCYDNNNVDDVAAIGREQVRKALQAATEAAKMNGSTTGRFEQDKADAAVDKAAAPVDAEAIQAAVKAAVAAERPGIIAAAKEAAEATMANREARRIVIDTTAHGKVVKSTEGLVHKQFETLLKMCQARGADGKRLNILLVGPAGSGKTTAARMAAKVLGLEFSFTGAIDTEYKLLGFTDAMGRTVHRPFRERWVNGGVFLFDEMDGSLAPALLAFNAPLANGWCDFPDACVERHEDTIALGATNTWGSGATAEYVGRNKLDAASMDRFVKLYWEIDEALEAATAPDSDWCKRVQRARAVVRAKGIKGVMVTPRATYNGAALLAQGFKADEVARMTYLAGLSEEQARIIQGGR